MIALITIVIFILETDVKMWILYNETEKIFSCGIVIDVFQNSILSLYLLEFWKKCIFVDQNQKQIIQDSTFIVNNVDVL